LHQAIFLLSHIVVVAQYRAHCNALWDCFVSKNLLGFGTETFTVCMHYPILY